MALTTFTENMDIIAALDDAPNDEGGLTPEQLKAKFDAAGNAVQGYVNGTLIPELDAAHLPYLYGGSETIKTTMENVVSGVMPDGSVDTDKIADGAVTPAKLGAVLAALKPWRLAQSYTEAGSYTYTVPEGVTKLGVYAIGGGGGGGAAAGVYDASLGEKEVHAVGGGSGYAKHRVLTVTGGGTVAVVVGAGGAGGSVTADTTNKAQSAAGSAGNATTINVTDLVAGGGGAGGAAAGASASDPNGANGGQGSSGSFGNAASAGASTPYGATPNLVSGDNGIPYYHGNCQSAYELMNPFDLAMDTPLAAGGRATSATQTAQTAVNILGGSSGAGAYVTSNTTSVSTSAATPTGYGCGGGGAAARVRTVADKTATATSAAGAPGAVFLYVME